MIRLRRLIAVTVWALLACLIIPPASAHHSEYEKCRDACKAKFKECYDKNCAPLPEDKRSKCWMECAGGEVKDCYEACEDKPRL